jgi:3',5'-cyclic AMP phosphodiesterase CpdA
MTRRFTNRRNTHTLLALLTLSVLSLSTARSEILNYFVTWERNDTARTISVRIITDKPAPEKAEVFYDWEPRQGVAANYRFRAEGRQFQIAGLNHVYVHKIEIFNLTPGRRFYFVAGSPENGFTPESSFHSLPLDPSSLRFVTGGDMGADDRARALSHEAGKRNPDFVVIGGDLAYGNGKLSSWDTWREYLTILQEELVKTDGSMIPIVAAIGNHEVNNDIDSGNYFEQSPFYMNLFAPKDGPTYFTRNFGNLLSLICLDSGHLTEHGGRQAKWLQYQLGLSNNMPYTMACYHIPLYPSHREYEGSGSKEGRKEWLPVFDRFQLTAALENHDHTLKRTVPLLNNKPAPEGKGTLYIGDGCFGRDPRVVYPDRWYLANAASTPHFWVIDLGPENAVFTAVDENGNEVDNTTRPPRR